MTQLPSEKPALFKGRHFNHLLIIQAVRGYVTYKLSYRDVCGLMAERGVTIERFPANAKPSYNHFDWRTNLTLNLPL